MTTQTDYLIRLRSSGVACLMSSTCSWCYPSGIRNSFFGVPVTGTLQGNRPQDTEFKKNIWKAARKHMKGVHGRKIIANGTGGWKVVKLELLDNGNRN